VLRIGTFRVPEDRPVVHEELRRLQPWGRSRWIGRRMMDDPEGPEIAVVSSWASPEEMEAEVATGQGRFGSDLAAAMASMTAEVYSCRAWGSWPRDEQPLLLRILRGKLVEGDAASFDLEAMMRYLANFERNPRCSGILAGIDRAGTVALVTLWTNWDAIVTATGGDLRQVLPVRLPGWTLGGTAVHYEVVVAETYWQTARPPESPAGLVEAR
jgi:hypothetical protein